jgi:hypothetical protein
MAVFFCILIMNNTDSISGGGMIRTGGIPVRAMTGTKLLSAMAVKTPLSQWFIQKVYLQGEYDAA